MAEISVLIPTQNRAHYITETIQSVLDQTFKDFEIVVIDDGSTDDTKTVVSSFNDPRIRYFYYDRVGSLPKLRNIAVGKSSGKFVAFIDSDDLWHPEKLTLCREMCLNNGCEVCISDCITFKGTAFSEKSRGYRLNERQNVNIGYEILINNVPLGGGTTLFFQRGVYAQLKGFDNSLHASDHDFVCRALFSVKSIYLPKVLAYVRLHDSNMSRNENNRDISSLLEYNVTLYRIYSKNGISKHDLHKTLARNHYLMAQHVLPVGGLSPSLRHFLAAVRRYPRLGAIVRHVARMLKYVVTTPFARKTNNI